MDDISKIYKLPIEKIHKNQLKFYHTNETKIYIPTKIDELYNNIKEYDYFSPIKKLSKDIEGKNNYYLSLVEKYDAPIVKASLEYLDKIDPIDADEIMLQYIQCRNKVIIFPVWNNNTIQYQELSKKGNIYYTKRIELNGNGIKNLLFMYANNEVNKKSNNDVLEGCEKMVDKLKMKKFSMNQITLIFFDNTKNLSQHEIIKTLNIPETDKNYYFTHNFIQMTDIAKTVLNKNSLFLLNNIDLKELFSKYFLQSEIRFETYRKYMYEQLSLYDINRTCIYGGTILCLLGIRKSNDIDSFMIGFHLGKEEDKEIEEQIHTNFHEEKTKFDFINIGIEKSKHWEKSKINKISELLKTIDVNSLTEITTNPIYHMYCFGMKMISIDLELIRKINRVEFLHQDIADIIVIYFYNRIILGHYIYLDRNNKLMFHKRFGSKKIKKTQDLIKKIKNFIDSRYSSNKSKAITDRVIDGILL